MLKVIGVTKDNAERKAMVMEVNKSKITRFYDVNGFVQFTIRYNVGFYKFKEVNEEQFAEDSSVLLYIPIQDRKTKFYNKYIKSVDDVLINIDLAEDGQLTSFVFDFENMDEEVYQHIVDLKSGE